MSLGGILSVASSGLADIGARIAVVSQNVANVNTPDYVREVAQHTSVTADGVGMGVATGPATRAIDTALQGSLFQQDTKVAELEARQTALRAIDAVQGTPGQGDDLAGLLGKLQDSFSALATDPGSASQQNAVVGAAGNLARQVNAVGAAIGTQRQAAADAVVSGVATLNASLATIGTLSDQIVRAKSVGQSTADLENQRDAALHGLARQIDVRALAQPNGDLLVLTPSGLDLPIHAQSAPFAATGGQVDAHSTYPGTIAGVTLNGADVTAQLSGGQIGAAVALRDTTLPKLQANLDEFAQTLSTRFAAQGLTLFSDASGTVPAGGGAPVQSTYVGYAATIQVNPLVSGAPSAVRDGTDTIAGSATGASAFTPNPAGGPAGFTGLVSRILNFALGSVAQANVPQAAPNVTGLGPSGTLSAGFAAPPDLARLAGAVVGQQAAQSAAASASLGTETSVQTALQGKLAAGSAVSIDQEMSTMVQLQNAYGANARIVSAVQSLFTQLLQMVQ